MIINLFCLSVFSFPRLSALIARVVLFFSPHRIIVFPLFSRFPLFFCVARVGQQFH